MAIYSLAPSESYLERTVIGSHIGTHRSVGDNEWSRAEHVIDRDRIDLVRLPGGSPRRSQRTKAEASAGRHYPHARRPWRGVEIAYQDRRNVQCRRVLREQIQLLVPQSRIVEPHRRQRMGANKTKLVPLEIHPDFDRRHVGIA